MFHSELHWEIWDRPKNAATALQTRNLEGHLEAQGLPTSVEEEVLVARINLLSARGLPLTPAMIGNLVCEIIKGHVGERWVDRFIKRHKDVLTSVYLTAIDH